MRRRGKAMTMKGEDRGQVLDYQFLMLALNLKFT
jgi:hypothetical protein